MSRYVTIQEILRTELGLDLPTDRPITISSPFRNDSSPSFRIYSFEGDEDDYNRGAYDWGTGKAYSNIGLIQEIRQIPYHTAKEVYTTEYDGISREPNKVSNNDKIDILMSSLELSHLSEDDKYHFLEALLFSKDNQFAEYLNTQIISNSFHLVQVGKTLT